MERGRTDEGGRKTVGELFQKQQTILGLQREDWGQGETMEELPNAELQRRILELQKGQSQLSMREMSLLISDETGMSVSFNRVQRVVKAMRKRERAAADSHNDQGLQNVNVNAQDAGESNKTLKKKKSRKRNKKKKAADIEEPLGDAGAIIAKQTALQKSVESEGGITTDCENAVKHLIEGILSDASSAPTRFEKEQPEPFAATTASPENETVKQMKAAPVASIDAPVDTENVTASSQKHKPATRAIEKIALVFKDDCETNNGILKFDEEDAVRLNMYSLIIQNGMNAPPSSENFTKAATEIQEVEKQEQEEKVEQSWPKQRQNDSSNLMDDFENRELTCADTCNLI